MGMIERVIEDHPNYQIVEIGGVVHYSWEFRFYLAGLPFEKRKRIIDELENHALVRREVRYKSRPLPLK